MIPLPPGNLGTFFTGCSKTGLPGAGILGVVLLANVMQDTRASVGVMLPVLIFADLFAVGFYRRHGDWRHILKLLPWTLAGLGLGYLVITHAANVDFSLLVNTLKVPLFVSAGMIDTDSLRMSLTLIPGVLAGGLAAPLLFKVIPPRPFGLAVRLLAAAAAIRLMWQAG